MDIAHYIAHTELLNRTTLYELRVIVGKNPCFDAARLLLLKNLYLLHDIEFGKEMRKAALYLKNRWVLFDLMKEYGNLPDEAEKTPATGEDLTIDRTMDLIDAFLGTLPEENFSLEAEGAAAIDYASAYLSDKSDITDSPKLRGQELIDKFLAGDEEKISLQLSHEHNEPKESETAEATSLQESEESPTFTETLANIYLKQGKYEKALEILKRINLEYPNKNRYFADQIRFLDKIVKHTKRK